MAEPVGGASRLSILTLREIRGYIRSSHAVMMTVTFSVLYALGAMSLGGMLVLFHQSGGTTVEILWGNALGQSPWLYPGLLVIAPWGYLELPFFPTIAMVFVSAGVGMGMAVAVLLAVALVRNRRGTAQASSLGTAAGLTPMMLTLVTLGACCSTTAAATAGVGLVAQVSGSSTNNLLLNNWVLGVFQIAVVWVALVAQEIVLRVYGGLFGRPTTASIAVTTARFDRRFVVGGLLRTALLIGGVTWSLAMLVEWTSVNPIGAPAALWFRWLFEYQLVAFLAILTALFPVGTYETVTRSVGRVGGALVRGGLLLGGLALVVGAPPPLSAWGIEGLGNELLGVLGFPASVGAVVPVFGPGLDLAFRWGVQYLLVGGFAVAFALRPDRALAPLRWTMGPGTPDATTSNRSPGWAHAESSAATRQSLSPNDAR